MKFKRSFWDHMTDLTIGATCYGYMPQTDTLSVYSNVITARMPFVLLRREAMRLILRHGVNREGSGKHGDKNCLLVLYNICIFEQEKWVFYLRYNTIKKLHLSLLNYIFIA